jgi:hypothetical protein
LENEIKAYTDGWTTFITHPYTIEERSRLKGFIEAEVKQYSYRDGAFNENYWITTENVTEPAFIMCMTPLSEIPLHINDKDPYVLGVVKWRLSIGK